MRNKRANILFFQGSTDTTAPVPVITSTESSPSWISPIPVTITFKNGATGDPETVTGFVVGDITVANCTLSNFANPSPGVYTVNATPTARAVTVDVAAGVCTDSAGNANVAATQFAITGFALPTDVSAADAQSLRSLYQLTAGDNWANKTNWGNNVTASTWGGISVAGGRVTQIGRNANTMVGNISTWQMPTALIGLQMFANTLSGNIGGWTLPATLTTFNLQNNAGLTGNIAGWTLSATFAVFSISNTGINTVPNLGSIAALQQYKHAGCGLSQAQVDAIVQAIYGRRASITYATPSSELGGSNAAPSGTYADEDPPTTGKGYIYELVNDPETEGFKKWTITYTA